MPQEELAPSRPSTRPESLTSPGVEIPESLGELGGQGLEALEAPAVPAQKSVFLEQRKEREQAIEEFGPLGWLLNMYSGAKDTFVGLGQVAALAFKGGYHLVTDPRNSASAAYKWLSQGGISALWDGTIEGLKTQYAIEEKGVFGGLGNALLYYPGETLLDIMSLITGAGAVLKGGARIAGGGAVLARAGQFADRASFVASLTKREIGLLKMMERGASWERLPGSLMAKSWDAFADGYNRAPLTKYLASEWGIGPTSKENRAIRKELARMDREIYAAMIDTQEKALRALGKRKLTPEDMEKLERVRDAFLPEAELDEPLRAYLRELMLGFDAAEAGLLRAKNLHPASFYARRFDRVVKGDDDLRRFLVDKHRLTPDALDNGLIGKPDAPIPLDKQLEFAQSAEAWLAERGRYARYSEVLPEGLEKDLMDALFSGETVGPRSAFLSKRENVANQVPQNFHQMTMRTISARVSLVKKQQALARILNSKKLNGIDIAGVFQKIEKVSDIVPGSGRVPFFGGAVMTMLSQNSDFAATMNSVLRGKVKVGAKVSAATLKEAFTEAIKKHVGAKGELLGDLQTKLVNSFGSDLYSVPYDVAKSLGAYLFPYKHPILSAVERVNSFWKLSVLALNPIWYVQNLVGGVFQAWMGTGAGPLGLHRTWKNGKATDLYPKEFLVSPRRIMDGDTLELLGRGKVDNVLNPLFNPKGIPAFFASFANDLDQYSRRFAFNRAFSNETKRLAEEMAQTGKRWEARFLNSVEEMSKSDDAMKTFIKKAKGEFEERQAAFLDLQGVYRETENIQKQLETLTKDLGTLRGPARAKNKLKAEYIRAGRELANLRDQIKGWKLDPRAKGMALLPDSHEAVKRIVSLSLGGNPISGGTLLMAMDEALEVPMAVGPLMNHLRGRRMRMINTVAEVAPTKKLIDMLSRGNFNRNALSEEILKSVVRGGHQADPAMVRALLRDKGADPVLVKSLNDVSSSIRENMVRLNQAFKTERSSLFEGINKAGAEYAAKGKQLERTVSRATRNRLDIAKKRAEKNRLFDIQKRNVEMANSLVDGAINSPFAEAFDRTIRSVDEALFNFHDMHPTHRMHYRNYGMPFFSWYIKIAQFAFSMPFKHPLRANLAFHLAKMATYANQDPNLPENIRGYTPVGFFPGTDEMLWINFDQFDPRSSFPLSEGRVVSALHPVARVLLQWVDGREILTRKPLREGVVQLANGRMYEVDPASGKLRARPALALTDIGPASEELLRMIPWYNLIFNVGLKRFTQGEKDLEAQEPGMVNTLRWIEGLTRFRLTTQKQIDLTKKMNLVTRTQIYEHIKRHSRALQRRTGTLYPWDDPKESVRKLYRAVVENNDLVR